MRRFPWFLLIVVVVAGALMPAACVRADVWTTAFPIAEGELASTGRNAYFILEPGYTLVLEGGGGRLTITVLNETKLVDGVETRVVEERETKNGKLIEVSRNFFAISRRTKDVFYFGEEVEMYKDDQVVSHDGSWLSGVNGAKFGLMMPGTVSLNARYYQELAPRVAMDRATIVGLSDTVKTPAGEFTNCVKVKETTPLEPFTAEYKYYAPGIGMVQDGALKLVKHGQPGERTGKVRSALRATPMPETRKAGDGESLQPQRSHTPRSDRPSAGQHKGPTASAMTVGPFVCSRRWTPSQPPTIVAFARLAVWVLPPTANADGR